MSSKTMEEKIRNYNKYQAYIQCLIYLSIYYRLFDSISSVSITKLVKKYPRKEPVIYAKKNNRVFTRLYF